MAVKIDSDKCGHIENCPVQGLCIKLCEQEAIIEEDGDVKIVPEIMIPLVGEVKELAYVKNIDDTSKMSNAQINETVNNILGDINIPKFKFEYNLDLMKEHLLKLKINFSIFYH